MIAKAYLKAIVRTSIFTLLLNQIFIPCNAVELVRDGKGYKAFIPHELEAEGKSKLEISSITGDVYISSWNMNKIRIVEMMHITTSSSSQAEKVCEEYLLEISEQGNVIVARGPMHLPHYVDISYEVTLPEKFSADVKTSGGDFEIAKLKGDYNFATSGGDLDIQDCEGNVTCATSGGDLSFFNIKGVLNAATSGGDIKCNQCGNDIELKTSGGDIELNRLLGNITARTSGGDIAVVDVKGTCSVKTSGGEISLHDIDSDRLVEAYTSGGDIEVANIKGSTMVKTSGGDIMGNNISGDFTATTSGGCIETEKISGGQKLSTSGGDITTNAEGFIEAITSGGDVEVSIMTYHPKKDQHIEMESSGGDLKLSLPSNFKGTIEAEIHISGAWEDYDIYSDFPLKITKESNSSNIKKHFTYHVHGTKTATGEINGGGNIIHLETSNGDIYIKKL